MKIRDIYNYLDSISPFGLQEKWDNSGLIVGNMNDEFDNIYISLDLDLDMLRKVKKNSLIITHHPLIFTALKTVNNDSYSTKILKKLIKKDISLISMHTNIDKTHLNSYVGREILGLNFQKDEDFILKADINLSFESFTKLLKDKLNLKTLKIVNKKKNINNVSLTTGSGMSLLPQITTDCFLTGDIKYHEAMEAKARDICLIDIGHYESEIHFIALLDMLLKKYLKTNGKKAIMLKSHNPFKYI
ncbi:Nif3-like dinuclear metal center hexameric protein [Arcobacter sp. 15-2]|uniref:Nif3-like dinuclear metal center hexameric protein n=1 Tax=Arcobacter sp. 15-2 TaxID=3374109 RepID=UPI00399C61ED